MSLDKLYGTWDEPRHPHPYLEQDQYQILWHALAAQRVGTPQQQNNSGLSQRKNEIIELWRLFHRQRPKVILEIGVAQAGTLAGWCWLAPEDATIIAIDRNLDDARPRPGDPINPMIYDGPLAYSSHGGGIYHLARKGQTMIGINGWSYEPDVLAKVKKALNGRTVDFMFCDSSHSAEMFDKEFNLYYPLVSPGGIYATHDIQPSADPNVTKNLYWEWLRVHGDYSAVYEFRGPRGSDSMGIGILIHP